MAKPAVTLVIGAGLLWLLVSRLGHLDPVAIRDAVHDVALHQWALALVAVAVSFLAVGGQERVLHRHLRTGVTGPQAFCAGIAAGAVSQTAGFGPLTGAMVRWRLLAGLTLWQATRISSALTVGFLSSLAILASVVLVALHATRYAALGWAILTGAAFMFTLATVRPVWLPKRSLWPNAITMLAFLFWAALDLAALCVALWTLFPEPYAPAFTTLLPVVLLALGAGLASGAPAGVGAFEMVLIALLTDIPTEPLMAAVLAWRAVFYALPAILGALWTALAPRTAPHRPDPHRPDPYRPAPYRPAPQPHSATLASRAETALRRQGELSLQRCAGQTVLTGRTPHILVAVFDPFPGPARTDTLAALVRLARAENRLPALYKADARLAATARRFGLRPLRIASEAVVTPSGFDLTSPALASLRRKLRKAASAGVTITRNHDRHCPALARINADWAHHHKGERGFSMGRFCPVYLSSQRLYVAWHAGQPVAFASFHTAAQEWTLDLMRHAATLPDGTMHSLIAAAIADARSSAVPRLSLAAVPAFPARLRRLLPAESDGLARFKQTFAPRWEGRYLCAPTLATLALAMAEIGRAIHHPAPLQPRVAPSPAPAHDQDAEYEFATVPASWQRKA